MKNSDLLNYKNAQSEEELDKYTSLILEGYFDQLQKEEWAEKLKTEYNVDKSKANNKLKISYLQKYFWWTTGIAAVITLFWFNFSIKDQFTTTDQFVSAELSQHLPYFGKRKGIVEDNTIRQIAYDNYQDNNFTAANTIFSQLDEKGKLVNQDLLFYALTFVHNQDYSNAAIQLEEISTQGLFPSHTNWYLSLVYYQLGQPELTIKALKKHISLNKNGFKYEEAIRFLERFE